MICTGIGVLSLTCVTERLALALVASSAQSLALLSLRDIVLEKHSLEQAYTQLPELTSKFSPLNLMVLATVISPFFTGLSSLRVYKTSCFPLINTFLQAATNLELLDLGSLTPQIQQDKAILADLPVSLSRLSLNSLPLSLASRLLVKHRSEPLKYLEIKITEDEAGVSGETNVDFQQIVPPSSKKIQFDRMDSTTKFYSI